MPTISGDTLLTTSPDQHMANRREKYTSVNRDLLRFPSNLGAHGTLMRFFEYTYGGVKGSVETPLAEVLLPLPKQLQDSFKVNLGGNELGIVANAASQAAQRFGEGGVTEMAAGLANTAGDAANSIGGSFSEAVRTGDFSSIKKGMASAADASVFLASGLGSYVAPDIVAGIGAGRGTAVNPFQTLVFKGIDLKIHSLEWLLSPESMQESEELKRIIRTLQRMVLPKTESPLGDTESGITALDKGILRYPAMVNIFLQGIDQNYYYKFKTSMISNLNIDYSPNGVAPLKGGKPSAVRITMTLQEAHIHTADDASTEEIEQEFLDESLDPLNLTSAEFDERREAEEEFYSDKENFSDIRADDEVTVIKRLADGSDVARTVTRQELNDQGILNSEIENGRPTGDETVIFMVG